ncbi:MAG: PilZ domain-containing protein [Candidatus Manganitrophaceae bacterium]|nr:MAG: PilZ domain-containing protein [Candidatus Manganitrophaceae bacterium]
MQNFFIGMDTPDAPSLDQRKQPRIAFSGKGSLSSGTRSIEIAIGNISLSGLLFHTRERFDLGKKLNLKIKGEEGGKPFEEQLTGTIVAVHRGDDDHSYGLQFPAHLTLERQPHLFAKIQRTLHQNRS